MYYNQGDSCNIHVRSGTSVHVVSFATESSDQLCIQGECYFGTHNHVPPEYFTADGSIITWSTRNTYRASGWKLCLTSPTGFTVASTLTSTLRTSVVATGDVSDFTVAVQYALREKVASELSLPIEDVTLTVEAASVRLNFEIALPAIYNAHKTQFAQWRLEWRLSTPAAASAFLSTSALTLNATSTSPVLLNEFYAPPSPPGVWTAGQSTDGSGGDDNRVIIAGAGGGAAFLIIIAGVVWWSRIRKKKAPPTIAVTKSTTSQVADTSRA
jgi:hypothetical protein